MPDIYETADQFRAALLSRERKAASAMVRAYGLSWQRIQIQLARLTKQIEQARARGEDVNQFWLLRQERYFALQGQVLAELQRFIKFAEPAIIAEQKAAVEAAQQQAATLMSKATNEARLEGSFNKLSPLAVERMVGFAGDGSPLRSLLNKLGADAALRVTDSLAQAVALGYNPRKTAAQIREALAGNLARALLISRTETIRAHREASRQTYLANDDVVEGWQWVAALGPRSCPVCWAMHGKVFPLTEPMGSHPACRCTSIPVLDVAAPSRVKPGAEEFARLSEAEQRQILGPGKFAAYKAGLPLENLVGFKRDPQWGPVRFERSLSAAKTGPMWGAMPDPLPKRQPPAPPPQPQPAPPPQPQVQPVPALGAFKTLKEAETWAAQNYPKITWDFKDADIETINPTLKQFHMLAQEYPEVAARVEYFGTYRGQHQGKFGFKGEFAHASRDGKRIGLNPDFYGDPQKYRDWMKQSTDAGWFAPNNYDFGYVLTHEFGHQVHNWLGAQAKVAILDVVGMDGTGIVAETVKLWEKVAAKLRRASDYARKNDREAFAEGFASLYYTPAAKLSDYARSQKALLVAMHPSRRKPTWDYFDDVEFVMTDDERRAALKEIEDLKKKLGL
jgi:SPP1 gp7 family putative phage head morphogenesis protein